MIKVIATDSPNWIDESVAAHELTLLKGEISYSKHLNVIGTVGLGLYFYTSDSKTLKVD